MLLLILPGTGRGTIRRMVEGARHRSGDRGGNGICVGEYLGSRNAENGDAGGFKRCGPSHVVTRPSAHIMRYAIDLDRKLQRCTVKVDHIWSNRMLSAKLNATFLAPNALPQQNLRVAHGATEAACGSDFRPK